jgi:hypothetical protein
VNWTWSSSLGEIIVRAFFISLLVNGDKLGKDVADRGDFLLVRDSHRLGPSWDLHLVSCFNHIPTCSLL